MLSDGELSALKARAAQLFGAGDDAVFGDAFYLALLDKRHALSVFPTGSYSQNWLSARWFERRTSLIEDPIDGRLPSLTPQAAQVRAARAGAPPPRARGAADIVAHRPMHQLRGSRPVCRLRGLYGIVQTPDQVAIQMEKIHDVRIVPLDGRAHLPQTMRQYLGDPRGHWEGDALVVETTNFHPKGNYMGGVFRYSDENLRLTERFTRVSDDTLRYEFTVDDPSVWTRPWTAAIYWKKSSGEIYEYACHEGNYSIRGILSALRAEEAGTDEQRAGRSARNPEASQRLAPTHDERTRGSMVIDERSGSSRPRRTSPVARSAHTSTRSCPDWQ